MKKTFNALFATIVCAAAVILTSSCNDDSIQPPKTFLSINDRDTTHTFKAENPDPFVVGVISNDTAWSVNVNSDDITWLTAIRENDSVVITVTNNDSEKERKGEITLGYTKETSLSKTITIIQEGLTIDLHVSDFNGVFAPDANGEAFAREFTITSNHSWYIEDIPEWLAFNHIEGNEEKTIRVWPISFNTASSDREAVVKVKSGSKETSIKIIQECLLFEISDTEKTFEFFNVGQRYAQEVDIVCNASWEIFGKQDWLDIETLEGNGSQKVKVWPNSINSGSGTSERSVNLTITAAGIEKNLKIVQTNNVPWAFCPDIILGLDRTSDEILAIFGDDGTVLEESVGYISYNNNIMALIFSIDSNNTCDKAMCNFRSSVSNDNVINHCNSHYETDVMIDLALLLYNQPNWKGWAKHDNEGGITTMIIYDTEKKILIASPFNSDDKQSVKHKKSTKETESALIREFTKVTEILKKQ